jgi:hypothetical protein
MFISGSIPNVAEANRRTMGFAATGMLAVMEDAGALVPVR